jgi:hypothetical protein
MNEGVQRISVLTSHGFDQRRDGTSIGEVATIPARTPTIAQKSVGARLRLFCTPIDENDRSAEVRKCSRDDLANLALGANAGQQDGRCAEHATLRMAQLSACDQNRARRGMNRVKDSKPC